MPNKTDGIQTLLPFGRHTVSGTDLTPNPTSKFELSFNVKCRHSAVTLADLEFLERRKALLPYTFEHAPNKSDAIQTLFPFSGHGVFASALGTNPHSEFIRPLDVIVRYSAVTLTGFKFL
jgi:hypothetical protein